MNLLFNQSFNVDCNNINSIVIFLKKILKDIADTMDFNLLINSIDLIDNSVIIGNGNGNGNGNNVNINDICLLSLDFDLSLNVNHSLLIDSFPLLVSFLSYFTIILALHLIYSSIK